MRSYRFPQLIWAFLLTVVVVAIGLTQQSPFGFAKNEKPVQREEVVEFAHFSDVHYDANGSDKTWRMLKDSPVLIESALSEVNEKPNLDFIVFTGDSVNTPKPQNFQGLFALLGQKTKTPYYMVLGNHDVGVKPNQDKNTTINTFRQLGGADKFPVDNVGWYSVSPKPWLRLIMLDGTTDEKISANGFIPQAELEWLKLQLQDAQKQKQMVVLFSHFPVVEPFHSKSHEIIPADSDKLLSLIEGSPNVVAFFSGHYHMARIQQRNGIYHVSSPPLIEYPNAYRTVAISKSGKLSLDWHPTRHKELSEKSRERSPHVPLALGNPKQDHTLSNADLRFRPAQ